MFLEDLGHKRGLINSEKRSESFLFQSIGISIQKGNAACILGTKGIHGKLEELSFEIKKDMKTKLKDVLGSWSQFHGFANIVRIKQESWNFPYISHLGWYLGSLWHHF